MKIIIDENISFALEAFSGLGEAELVNGRKIPASLLKEAEALVVRSTTNVNRDLLDGTKIKFVGTATIGTDHIDLDYLKERNIAFSSAAGCNSQAVAEYVISIEGKVRKRPAGTENAQLATGMIDVMVDKLVILNEAKTPPFPIED
ncbi:MAG TPA: hypothetical protein VHP30_12165, partial [Ignavibacteriales bacterium]|nr:hypothetical protein [Ignavibacteriales bacterium]